MQVQIELRSALKCVSEGLGPEHEMLKEAIAKDDLQVLHIKDKEILQIIESSRTFEYALSHKSLCRMRGTCVCAHSGRRYNAHTTQHRDAHRTFE